MNSSIGMDPNLSRGAAAETAEINAASFAPSKRIAIIKPQFKTPTTIAGIKKCFLISKSFKTLMTNNAIGINKNK